MKRVKALYRSWGILCGGQQGYAPGHRAEWLNKIGEAGVRRRAEFFYQQLDALSALRQAVRRDLLTESRKQSATKLLRQIPSIGPIRSAQRLGSARSKESGAVISLRSVFGSRSTDPVARLGAKHSEHRAVGRRTRPAGARRLRRSCSTTPRDDAVRRLADPHRECPSCDTEP